MAETDKKSKEVAEIDRKSAVTPPAGSRVADSAPEERFPLGDLPAMIDSGGIRAASTAAAVLMIGQANNN